MNELLLLAGGALLLKVKQPSGWREVSDLQAVIRDDQVHSLKAFVQPSQVSSLIHSDLPIGDSIMDLFQRVVIPIPYVLAPTEWLYPQETLIEGGDCADTANLFTSLVLNLIPEVYSVGGYFTVDDPQAHAWSEVTLNGRRYIFETTLDFMPRQPWVDAQTDVIASYYTPLIRWNNKHVYLQGDYYKRFFYGPTVTPLPKFSSPGVSKKDAIYQVWRQL